MKKYCQICSKEIMNKQNKKFCSKICGGVYFRKLYTGTSIPEERRLRIIKNHSHANKGHKFIEFRNEGNPRWKGESASYAAIHAWVTRYLGKPKYCVFCGKQDIISRYHWANKSGEYKRDLSDWIRLCIPCHSAHDKDRKSIRRKWPNLIMNRSRALQK